jgi:predicted unusual protein kinase regulating ubiquinone biosynthesis (AarF/ABC1/UbiB family)
MTRSPRDKKRYRKLRRFVIIAAAQIVWSDVILNRPLLQALRTPHLPRWQALALRYRSLALEMGGLLIKLGQFVSIRSDIIPPEVTGALAGLQDEVPAERLEDVVRTIEQELGRPLAHSFCSFVPEPLGAASLAQAHRAWLPSGEDVVVKVLRWGIEDMVEADLAALALAVRWLKRIRQVARRVDLDRLLAEFSAVTRNELNLCLEGRNAERFARDFAGDPQVYIPHIYWEYSTTRILTMENVSYIKMGDNSTIDAAGISRAEVARKLYDLYMRQIFMTHFVHADPHPGNLFVKPLPHPDEVLSGAPAPLPGTPVSFRPQRSFQIAFVDFGMIAIVPPRLREGMREYLIGIGTRDAHRIVQSYVLGGMLLPGADLQRLEEWHDALLDRFDGGMLLGQLNRVDLTAINDLANEYRDLVASFPVQLPADMLFTYRAMGVLSGITTSLDAEFDPWRATLPFATALAKESVQKDWQTWLSEAVSLGQLIFRLPAQWDRVLSQAQRGNLTVKAALAPDTRKAFGRLEQSMHRLAWMVIAAALFLGGILWHATNVIAAAIVHGQSQKDSVGTWLIVLAVIAFGWGMLRRP